MKTSLSVNTDIPKDTLKPVDRLKLIVMLINGLYEP